MLKGLRRIARKDTLRLLVTAASISSILAGSCVGLQLSGTGPKNQAPAAPTGYVGSRGCAKCHPSIYESFSRTDMGRSMSDITLSLLGKLPISANVFDPKLNRHFEIYAHDGNLFQAEYEIGADQKEILRETHKLDWILGAGANGLGAIVKRDDYLFEAPLSFYAKTNTWSLSPGYEFGDYGFNRPILPGCIVCHSGQPQPVTDGNGRFHEPPFMELAIGCENCHGPGESHSLQMQMGGESESGSRAIVNPAKLSPWLADNVCMSCHQTGDARVLKAGRQYRDFRPGGELDNTLSIFLVPFARDSVPKDDLLEHYLSMRLSKCYRNSGGKLSCITCHDPHVEPTQQEAPAYFRQKCMACHAEKSCAVPLSLRERKNPPDDCAGCHMPKRDVKVISHSALTNHRIIAVAEEPFPAVAFHMTTSQLPDLVHLSANPESPRTPSQLTLLEAYSQVMLSHPEYRERYWRLAKQLEATQPENVVVLEALADWALQKKTADASIQAIRYFDSAIHHGATNPADFEQLATLLIATHRQSEALTVLHQGIQAVPYYAELYRVAVSIDLSVDRKQEACQLVSQAVQNFPQDREFRSLLKKCIPAQPPGSN